MTLASFPCHPTTAVPTSPYTRDAVQGPTFPVAQAVMPVTAVTSEPQAVTTRVYKWHL